jgi:transglutaminase-like putative cysteine protease
MNTPPFLLGAALLFWGWQAGFLWLGALLAVSLESSRWIRARWEFAQTDLDRIWNLCVLLFFGAFVVAFVANDGANTVTSLAGNNSSANRLAAVNKSARSVILMLLWLPVTLLPMVVAQAFSQRERMAWSTFSPWLRRQRSSGSGGVRPSPGAETSEPALALNLSHTQRTGHLPAPGDGRTPGASKPDGLNVAWPYFAACLLAASAANEKTIWFSIGLVVLAGWALWTRRPRSFPAAVWTACLLAVVGLGFAAQTGMREMQELMRRLDGMLIAKLSGGGRGFDPKESRTALGAIGRLKLSGSIVLRVEAEGAPPPLLREASYKLFRSPYWAVPKAQQDFFAVNSENDLTTWKLLASKPSRKAVIVSGFLSGGRGLLAVPHGASKLEELLADKLETNKLGVLNVTEGPGFVRFRALYDEGMSIDAPPDKDDGDMPSAEREAVVQVANQLRLRDLEPEAALKAVAAFLAGDFRYTTWQEPRRRRTNETALTEFLLKTRAGHCEHFATATTMLLRAAGVPARYAVGYSVQEKKGEQWVVRERHAHAWSLAWVNGAWRDVDNTPASWAATEASRATRWEKISDAWSNVWFAFSKWRWGKGEWKRYLIWLVIPLIGLTVWRLMTQKQWSRAREQSAANARAWAQLGLDSEFYLIERKLLEQGLERREGETLSAWLARIGREGGIGAAGLTRLLTLHYRLRFDPAGLNHAERAALRTEAMEWVGRNGSLSAKS